ncbi:MAG: stage IV sporulation protein A [Clostridia bacterium]|nr:stage IV sporulation protein A [Clostridia bacterium]
MTSSNIYNDIAVRTGGDIYIGVVGPVRTGKSTFIKQFMDTLVIPNIADSAKRERATDELPQSASGRTIMTTEPKFIPEEAVEISLPDNALFRVRMIDCVGYIVSGALGYIEDDKPRMVKTPWFDKEIPFNMAAEVGTQKVISEHSTIGLVVTTDGSISDIAREEYEDAELRVINELKEINKPFVVLLNSAHPESEETKALSLSLSVKYGVPVKTVNCMTLDSDGVKDIIAGVLYEFPVKEVRVDLPGWVMNLPDDCDIRVKLRECIKTACEKLKKVRDVNNFAAELEECNIVKCVNIDEISLADGSARLSADIEKSVFYKVLSDETGLDITDDEQLMSSVRELAEAQKAYARFKNAIDEVEATGYGIVMPTIDELSLEEPEIMRQGGRYGVRLKASAPSIHIMKANINTEVAPIVGSESQSEELVMYLLKEFEENPAKIWDSNIFGKSLHELVNEGLHNKLYRMPTNARMKLQETLEKVINEGCSGLICIIL